MNKKLVALAVAGVLAAPLAQAQTANVTLYGRVNLDVEFVNGQIYDKQRHANRRPASRELQRKAAASRPIRIPFGKARTRRASACAARNRWAVA